MSEAGPVLYDPVELRRRIAVSFSIGELRALAESLGVGGIAWERGIDDAAREVVRQCERYAGLPALVARLREERPLVEWPAPGLDGAAIPRTLVSEGGPAAPAPATAGAFSPHPTLSASPGAFGPPAPAAPPAIAVPAAPPSGPSFRDPYAPPPGPPAIAVPAAPPPSVASVASAPRAGWPGVVNEPPKAAIGIDPRILIAVAGLMVVAAVIAYLAGRASTVAGSDAASAASASSTSGTAPGTPGARADGPAASVADAFARSFANMARACELPSSAGSNALVFRRIFEHCGPSAPPQQRRPTPSTTAAADGSADPAPASDPPPARNKRPGRGDAPPGEAAPTGKSCVSTCDAQHASCRAHCGPEPTESSAYDGYTRCMGGCLKEASRCRLNCR